MGVVRFPKNVDHLCELVAVRTSPFLASLVVSVYAYSVQAFRAGLLHDSIVATHWHRAPPPGRQSR
jgi:hypothetical protein